MKLEVGGGRRAAALQQVAEEAHEAAPQLDELEATVHDEVPGEGLAEGGDAHLETGDGARGRGEGGAGGCSVGQADFVPGRC